MLTSRERIKGAPALYGYFLCTMPSLCISEPPTRCHPYTSRPCCVIMPLLSPDAVAQLVDCRLTVLKVGSSNSNWVKLKTYKTDACHYPTWNSALIGSHTAWVAQYQHTVTKWHIRSWCWWHDLPVRQHYKVAKSMHCHKSVRILIFVWCCFTS